MAKKNSERGALFLVVLIVGLILIAIVGPVMGTMRMVRGYRRGIFATIFSTVILNLLIWGIGAFMLAIAVSVLDEEIESSISVGMPLVGLTGFGFLIGVLQRPGRKRQFAIDEENAILLAQRMEEERAIAAQRMEEEHAIAQENETFLLQNGIQETGGEDVTHIDSNNNKLRLLEENNDMLVFMAVGRRNRRAYINFDQDGRMIEYTGVVKL